MTPKHRLLASIRGEEVDRVAWSPFLAYFWESMPRKVQDEGQLKFLEDVGADPLLRGFHQLFTVKRCKCIVRERINGNEKFIEFETPVGTIHSRHIYTASGNTWFLLEHPVKSKEDFKVLAYLYEDMRLIPEYDRFITESNELGERGLHLPVIGTDMKTSFQALLEFWVGTEELVYALADYPELVEECLGTMQKESLDSVNISVDSPAEAFIFWEDSSTTNISPAYFEKYIASEINDWGRMIHASGKYLIHHACGHVKALLPFMAKTEIDLIESMSPPPTGDIEIWEARNILPENIGIIGGIEPTVFLNSSANELEEYVIRLLDKMGKQRYILANSDSCPPGVALEKFKQVTGIVRSKSSDRSNLHIRLGG